MDFNIHPFVADLSNSKRDESTNSAFCLGSLADLTDSSILLENDGLEKICRKNFAINKPDNRDLNRILAQASSFLTSPLR
jgi:tubulin alpha